MTRGGRKLPMFRSPRFLVEISIGPPKVELGGWIVQAAGMDPLSLSVGSDRIYLAVLEYQSDIWVMDLEY
jgi:hypothetical protein